MTQQELNDIYSAGILVLALLGYICALLTFIVGFLIARK